MFLCWPEDSAAAACSVKQLRTQQPMGRVTQIPNCCHLFWACQKKKEAKPGGEFFLQLRGPSTSLGGTFPARFCFVLRRNQRGASCLTLMGGTARHRRERLSGSWWKLGLLGQAVLKRFPLRMSFGGEGIAAFIELLVTLLSRLPPGCGGAQRSWL